MSCLHRQASCTEYFLKIGFLTVPAEAALEGRMDTFAKFKKCIGNKS